MTDQRASIPSAAGREAATTPLVNDREMEYLELRAGGALHKDIARSWGVTRSTVKGFGWRLRTKLGVASDMEAARLVFGWRLP